ncbi:hypothetical protein NOVOSPHI9U_310057 [Novosphingobium sp. 9U]|nr:hypothetical protein NOVOSPHI9U_310057 [Novosphingobium sp. 9U]
MRVDRALRFRDMVGSHLKSRLDHSSTSVLGMADADSFCF